MHNTLNTHKKNFNWMILQLCNKSSERIRQQQMYRSWSALRFALFPLPTLFCFLSFALCIILCIYVSICAVHMQTYICTSTGWHTALLCVRLGDGYDWKCFHMCTLIPLIKHFSKYHLEYDKYLNSCELIWAHFDSFASYMPIWFYFKSFGLWCLIWEKQQLILRAC